MALQSNSININFGQGLDLKTDSFQLQIGRFLALNNSVFTKAGMLQKRNGFAPLNPLPDNTSLFLTTFNQNLTAIGSNLQAYLAGPKEWKNTGSIQPLKLNTLPLVRNNTNQSSADSVLAPNGLVLTAFVDNIPSSTGINSVAKYAIADSITGQTIVPASVIPVLTGSPIGQSRVFLLGGYFVILFTNLIGSTFHLQYIVLTATDGTIISAADDIAASYQYTPELSFDAIVSSNTLYIAYSTNSGGQAVRVAALTQSLSLLTSVAFTGEMATLMGVTLDASSPSTPILYINWFNSADSSSHTAAVNQNLNTILAPISYSASADVLNITGVAANGVLTLIAEIDNNYSYDASIPTHYIEMVTITQAGVIGTPVVVKRSVGLASKAFVLNNNAYFLVAYQSPYQPTYYLIDLTGKIIAQLAYTNGGGYLTNGLPNVSLADNVAYIPYLFKDSVQAVNKNTNVPTGTQTAGIYAQTGVNLATFEIGTSRLSVSEIGANLNISGGFITGYDGNAPTEQNFFVYPDSIEVEETTISLTPTVTTTLGSFVLSDVSSLTGIEVGQTVSGTGIPSGALIIGITDDSITLDQAANANGSPVTITVIANVSDQTYFYQVTYEWADNQGNLFRSAPSIPVSIVKAAGNAITVHVPTLRLTSKIANPVKISIYRWSTAQQNYYQVTSIFQPVLNDTTIDSIDFVDSLADIQILGNNLIYTTGAVIENTAPPASDLLTLFNNRLWVVDSEDRNLLWYSKQVIEATPVEMSNLLTLYVAPSTASQGSTGPITAIAPMDDKLIVFKNNALGYINGVGPDNTGANNQYSDFILINSVVGCSNQQSIVFTPQGLMFQSNKGIWLLGRDLSTQYIGAAVEQYNSASVLSALNIPETNQVRFTLDNGITLMYDYYFAQWGTFSSIPAISSTIYNGLHTYINAFGQALQETQGKYVDNGKPTLMNFTTGWINLAGVQGLERFYSLFLLGVYYSPFTLAVQMAYDYNSSIQQSVIVRPENQTPNWGGDAVWGSNQAWGGIGKRFEARVFPDQQQLESFQITVSESYDSTYGQPAGQGLTLSGMNIIYGAKRQRRNSSSGRNFG